MRKRQYYIIYSIIISTIIFVRFFIVSFVCPTTIHYIVGSYRSRINRVPKMFWYRLLFLSVLYHHQVLVNVTFLFSLIPVSYTRTTFVENLI